MKSFKELREAKVTAKFDGHTPDKDFNDLAKKSRVKVTHDRDDETTTIHGDEKGVLSVLKTMYGNDWKYMYTKKGSTYVAESVKLDGDASELTEETYAPEVQTKYGIVHVSKRDTKGMRGKQDGFKLTLKTKSGKTVDLGSHPRPNDANIKSIAKSVMESVELGEAVDFMKMSKELLKHKSKGIEYEKAAAYIRVIHNNSAVSVQDKAFMALTKMLKDMDDLVKKTTITKILKDNGFKVKGGSLMREEVEPITENYRTLATHGMGAETKNSINVGRDVDYYEPKNGDKRMGKVTKMTRSGYVVKDEKDGKPHAFAFYDRAKAKEIMAKGK